LVDEAEKKLEGRSVNLDVLATEIAPLFHGDPIDAVVLACTHFPLLKEELRAVAPYPVTWIDSGDAIARRVETLLNQNPHHFGQALKTETAFSTGTESGLDRIRAFSAYGFPRFVSLGTA
jgi:glutamate racemase